MHFYFETPPLDQVDRWAGRPFRAYSVVTPPSTVNLNPVRTEAAKKRFLNNLWDVQARYRTLDGQSVVVKTEETEVENRGGKITMARTYFNVYQRTAFLQELRKVCLLFDDSELIMREKSADLHWLGRRRSSFILTRMAWRILYRSEYVGRRSWSSGSSQWRVICQGTPSRPTTRTTKTKRTSCRLLVCPAG